MRLQSCSRLITWLSRRSVTPLIMMSHGHQHPMRLHFGTGHIESGICNGEHFGAGCIPDIQYLLMGGGQLVQKAEEEGLRSGSRPYAQDPRQERAGPSLPPPQQQPVEGWREAGEGARWQGPAAEVCSPPLSACG